jgi:type II secretion system protein N
LKPLKFNYKISKKNICYGAYLVGITIFFLYALFPSDTVKRYLANGLRQGYPNVTVTIETVNPILPPGIQLHHLSVSYRDLELFRLEKVKIMPRLRSLFGSNTTMIYEAEGYAGKFTGKAEFAEAESGRGANIDGRISEIQVQGIHALQQLSAHKISGRLDGSFNVIETGSGRALTGKLSVLDCRIEFAAPILLQEDLTFREINAELILNDRGVTIKNGTLKGNDMDAGVAGTVGLNNGAGRNALNLIGTVTPHHALLARIDKHLPPNVVQVLRFGKNAIPFKISGTFKDPGFSFN